MKRSQLVLFRVVGVVALFGLAAEGHAVDRPLAIGIRGGVEIVAASEYQNQPDSPAVELFVRWSFSPSLSAEVSAGYRKSSFTQVQGGQTTAFSLTQMPILAGAAWNLLPAGPIAIRAGAGAAIFPSRTTWTQAAPGGREERVEMTTTGFGGYAGLTSEMALFDNLFVDVGVRFFWNPLPAETGRPTTQNYFSVAAGFSSRF